jgi:hypothetical protein
VIQIQTFTGGDDDVVSQQSNEWLANRPTLKIVSVTPTESFADGVWSFTITIVYEVE